MSKKQLKHANIDANCYAAFFMTAKAFRLQRKGRVFISCFCAAFFLRVIGLVLLAIFKVFFYFIFNIAGFWLYMFYFRA